MDHGPCQQVHLGGLIPNPWAVGLYMAEHLTHWPMAGTTGGQVPPPCCDTLSGPLTRPAPPPPLDAAVGNLRWLGPCLDTDFPVKGRGREGGRMGEERRGMEGGVY